MPCPTITIATPASIETHGQTILVDRKFHVGIERQASLLGARVLCLAPEGPPPTLDPLEHDRRDLSYEVLNASDPEAVERAVSTSDLVYGLDLRAFALARSRGIPYIAVTEYSFGIRWNIAGLQAKGARGVARKAKSVWHHAREQHAVIHAAAVHCNGYPAYHAARLARRRLLYFDSRMGAGDVISPHALDERLATVDGSLPFRLVFSGRLEPIKGALDLVDVAAFLRARGAWFVFDVYGDGSERAAMQEAIDRRGLHDTMFLHGVLPYPELVERVRGADLFVCCHPQGDPSCTYLETFGAGVPIAGYANEMWAALARESRGGLATPVGDRDALARAIDDFLRHPWELERASRAARNFALAHNFDREFERRAEDLRAYLSPQSYYGGRRIVLQNRFS